MRQANRKLALERKAQGKDFSIFIGVTFAKHSNMWRARRRINGKMEGFGYFDIEADAGRAADELSRRFGEHSKVNFTEDGTPTGHDGSVARLAAGTANFMAASAARKKGRYAGVLKNESRRSPNKWYVRFKVKNCKLNKTACQSVATKCGCGTTEITSRHYYLTEEQAAREHDNLVRQYDLSTSRDLHFPLVVPQVS